MTKAEIMEFIKKSPVFALATCQGGRPRVRNMMTSFADEQRGIVFCTGKAKDLYAQLYDNPKVELCYCNTEQDMQIRISGTVEETDDLGLKEAIVEKFEFLKPWIEEAGYDAMAAFRLRNAKACVWTMETNDEHKEYIAL
jgi:uncharacterized pyridoxamine 5'-phosphate oxidase family protein